jgi:hypothetical protein
VSDRRIVGLEQDCVGWDSGLAYNGFVVETSFRATTFKARSTEPSYDIRSGDFELFAVGLSASKFIAG